MWGILAIGKKFPTVWFSPWTKVYLSTFTAGCGYEDPLSQALTISVSTTRLFCSVGRTRIYSKRSQNIHALVRSFKKTEEYFNRESHGKINILKGCTKCSGWSDKLNKHPAVNQTNFNRILERVLAHWARLTFSKYLLSVPEVNLNPHTDII